MADLLFPSAAETAAFHKMSLRFVARVLTAGPVFGNLRTVDNKKSY